MKQVLQFVKCDLQVAKNNVAHRTSGLSRERRLFLRRGQEFTITLSFKEHPDLCQELVSNVTLTARTGPSPSKLNGTKVTFPVSSLGDRKSWSARVVGSDHGSCTVSVTSPAGAIIGHYVLSLRVTSQLQSSIQELGEFMLLFNPWCADDTVFLHNETRRQEYVLSEDGIIFLGTNSCIQPHPWHFGQFEEDISDICIKFLDMNPHYQEAPAQRYARRNDPVYVSQVISDTISRRDEEDRVAFMVGNGTPAYNWMSSVPVLQQWFQSDCQPVYGHHWVFAAVLCTVFRCLGIPTRVVTNYNSAHDTDRTLRMDKYHDEGGARVHRGRNDSIWNFHVWNESWMERRDLPERYSGWQVLDATGQQKSNGAIYCSGPAPVRAIRDGDVDRNYHVSLIFSKVVTDCAVWVRNSEGKFRRALSSTKYVGDSLCTKTVGSDRAEDITQDYKHPGGSAKESEVLQKAKQKMLKDSQPKEDRDMPLAPILVYIVSQSSQLYGQDVSISVMVTNVSSEGKDLQLVVGAQSVHDNGITRAQFWKEECCFHLSPREERGTAMMLCYSGYEGALLDNNVLRITALVKDSGSSSLALAEQDVTACKPVLAVQVPKIAVQYQPATAQIRLQNPLMETLETCVIRVSGKGLLCKERRYRCGDVDPGSTLLYPVTFTPTQVGARRLCVQLECSKFRGVTGFQGLEVLAADVQQWPLHRWDEVQRSARRWSTSDPPQAATPLSVSIQSDDSLLYGQDLSATVRVANHSGAETDLRGLLCAQYLHKNTSSSLHFWKEELRFSIQAQQEKTVSVRLLHAQYADILRASGHVRITALVQDVSSTVCASRKVAVFRPALTIQMQEDSWQYQLMAATISITNPLAEALEGCKITVSGEGLIYRERSYSYRDVEPSSTQTYDITFAPTQTGAQALSVRFDCRQFRGVRSSRSVEVLPSEIPASRGQETMRTSGTSTE